MNFDLLTIPLAQAAAPAASQGGILQMLLPMVIIFAIFYFMMIRPQQRKEKERRLMIDNIKSGARIMFCGGVFGTVTNVKDDVFIVRVAEKTKIAVARGAVNRVLEAGEKLAEESQE